MANFAYSSCTIKGAKNVIDEIENMFTKSSMQEALVIYKKDKSESMINNPDEKWVGLPLIYKGVPTQEVNNMSKMRGFIVSAERDSEETMMIASEDAWECALGFYSSLLRLFEVEMELTSSEAGNDYYMSFSTDPRHKHERIVVKNINSGSPEMYVGKYQEAVNECCYEEYFENIEAVEKFFGVSADIIVALEDVESETFLEIIEVDVLDSI